MLIAEEFLLLCLDGASGRRRAGSDKIDPALSAALLAELALRERIGVTGEDQGWQGRRRLTVTNLTPTDDTELDRALQAVAASEGRKVADLVRGMSSRRLSKGLRDRLLTRLAAARVVERRPDRILGLLPVTYWPLLDQAADREIRDQLHGALVDGTTPTERTVTLVTLLHATGLLTKVLRVADPRAVKARAKVLSEGDWVSRVVKQAIDEAAGAASAAM